MTEGDASFPVPLAAIDSRKQRAAKGATVTTIEIPANGEPKLWHHVLQELRLADGMVVLRSVGQASWEQDSYELMVDLWGEIMEVIDTRANFIVHVAAGPVRSLMMILPSLADISLATPGASFGLPEVRVGACPALAMLALKQRLTSKAQNRLLSTGESIGAREAQRIGLVDYVGDVEAEVERLILKNCRPRRPIPLYRSLNPDLLEGAEEPFAKS